MALDRDKYKWAENSTIDPTTFRPTREEPPEEIKTGGLKYHQALPYEWYNYMLYALGQAINQLEDEQQDKGGTLQQQINQLTDNFTQKINTLEDKLIPKVGDTWITKSTETPSARFGVGTWSLIKGKVLVGYDETDTDYNIVGTSGGSKQHTHTDNFSVDSHTLADNEVPLHSHELYGTDTSSASVEPLNGAVIAGDTNGGGLYTNVGLGGNQLVSNAGGGDPHTHGLSGNVASSTHLDPYHVVYIWERLS